MDDECLEPRSAKRTRLGFAAVGLVIVTLGTGGYGSWAVLDEGVVGVAWWVVLILLSSIPFVLYVQYVRTQLISVVTGSSLLVLTALVYLSVYRNEHSTSTLGFFASVAANLLLVFGARTLTSKIGDDG